MTEQTSLNKICPHWSAFCQRGDWTLARCDSATPIEGWEEEVAETCIFGFSDSAWKANPSVMLAFVGDKHRCENVCKSKFWESCLESFQNLSGETLENAHVNEIIRLINLKQVEGGKV